MKCKIAIIPAYEPDNKLIHIVKELYNNYISIIVVNDGSSKKYNTIFEDVQNYATVIHHKTNQGKGDAIKTALEYLCETIKESASIITVDADGQHCINDINNVLKMSEEKPDCLILGSRKFDSNVPFKSKFGNTFTRMVFKLSSGIYVRDTQTGLRAFSSDMILFLLAINGSRYEYEMNMLLECARNNISIVETDIKTIYIDNNSSSHFNAVKDSIRIYADILKFSCSSIIAFIVDFIFYSLFCILTSGIGIASIILSNVLARIISSSVNFSINRHFVFKSKGNIVKQTIQYFSLAICILICNTALLQLLVNVLNFNKFGAKILIEVIFFFISWSVQKFIIFKNKNNKELSKYNER